ncbi:MAG: ABC transporter ATP-binding protein, partial [Caldimonas sp.]
GGPVAVSILEVRDLHVWFDLQDGGELHAVQGLGLDVEAGERVGLVGESGCGKSTTVLAILGLLPPSATVAGDVRLDGESILTPDEEIARPHRWKDISMVFQGAMNALNPVKTVEAQIVEPMELHGTAEGADAHRRAGELLEMVGIPASAGARFPHEFSGGMRQRAALAMALACDPKVLLADEPTTALDVMVQAQILELLARLARDLGLALILVTHDLPVVAQVCERAAVMYAGEIVEEGTMERLFHSPRHPYTRMLLDAIPDIHMSGRSRTPVQGEVPNPLNPPSGCSFHPRCPHANERCRAERPKLLDFGGARIACHAVEEGRI